ncbi:MAG: hypothetical protein EOO29_14185 [Comamonadaceae bacterium]|nr:MAG: hypothetical protein EOO29_14185 [Comamonadaceae bacterium]
MSTPEDDVPSNLAELRTHVSELRAQSRETSRRVGHLEGNVDALRQDVAENTTATRNVERNTADLIEIFLSWKGAFKVLDQMGKLAKPLGAIFVLGAAMIGFWQAIKTGFLR